MKKIKKNNKGFSLVELIVVIAIMAVLVGVIAPAIMNNIEKSRESKDVQVLDSIASACQMALTDEAAYAAATAGTWPKKLADVLNPAATDAYYKKVLENLGNVAATSSSVNMTSTKGKTGTIYVSVVAGSQVKVYVTTATDGAESGIVSLTHLKEADGAAAKKLIVTR